MPPGKFCVSCARSTLSPGPPQMCLHVTEPKAGLELEYSPTKCPRAAPPRAPPGASNARIRLAVPNFLTAPAFVRRGQKVGTKRETRPVCFSKTPRTLNQFYGLFAKGELFVFLFLSWKCSFALQCAADSYQRPCFLPTLPSRSFALHCVAESYRATRFLPTLLNRSFQALPRRLCPYAM